MLNWENISFTSWSSNMYTTYILSFVKYLICPQFLDMISWYEQDTVSTRTEITSRAHRNQRTAVKGRENLNWVEIDAFSFLQLLHNIKNRALRILIENEKGKRTNKYFWVKNVKCNIFHGNTTLCTRLIKTQAKICFY